MIFTTPFDIIKYVIIYDWFSKIDIYNMLIKRMTRMYRS